MASKADPYTNAYRRLIDIGIALSAERDIDSLLERILREAKDLTRADAGTLYLVTSRRTLRFAIVLNDTLAIHEGGVSDLRVSLPDIPLNESSADDHIACRAANRGATVRVDDAYSSDLYDFSGTREFDKLTGYRSVSFLTVPMKNFSGEVLGVLQLINAQDESGNPAGFTDDVVRQAESLASLACVALENRYLLDEQEDLKKKLEREVDTRTRELKDALAKLSEAHIILKEITATDAVTGIRNRHYFEEIYDQEWRRAARQRYELSLLLLDIDYFKRVNDTFGHLAGDDCLAEVARKLDSMFNRPSDVVARYGGEEFVVILPYVELDKAERLAEQVREAIANETFVSDGKEISVTISIGLSSVVPEDGMDAKQLISAADEALYRAKTDGRNCVRVFVNRSSGTRGGI